jgi:catechol 2,3-dioxygenase-like lactoylglutathione lyase family enzyme
VPPWSFPAGNYGRLGWRACMLDGVYSTVMGMQAMIRKLHHNAYRCSDSERTRRFYEDFLGLRLAGTLEITQTKTGREADVLHTFYELGDGSYLAFFEAPGMPFEFKDQHDFDLHIALEVDEPTLLSMFEEGKRRGIETRGISDHDFIHSIYFRDPDGYVIELTTRLPHHDEAMDPAVNGAREKLDRWQSRKAQSDLSGAQGPEHSDDLSW